MPKTFSRGNYLRLNKKYGIFAEFEFSYRRGFPVAITDSIPEYSFQLLPEEEQKNYKYGFAKICRALDVLGEDNAAILLEDNIKKKAYGQMDNYDILKSFGININESIDDMTFVHNNTDYGFELVSHCYDYWSNHNTYNKIIHSLFLPLPGR